MDDSRRSKKYIKWQKAVFIKDEYKCQHCGTKDKLVAHHKIPWRESKELRFEIDNGLTLCKSCHMRHHYENATKRFPKGHIPWNKGIKGIKGGTKKGTKFSKEHKDKLSKAKINRKPWNVGIAMKEETKEIFRKKFKGKKWEINILTGKRKWID